MCIYFLYKEREIKIYFKKLAYNVVEAVKSKVCRAGQQLEIQVRVDAAILSQTLQTGNSGGASVLQS